MNGIPIARWLSCALGGIAIVAIAACSRSTREPERTAAREITFNRDIAPILFNNCATCHRPIDPPPPAASIQASAQQAASKVAATSGFVRRSPEGNSEGSPPAEADPICVAGAPFSVLDYDAVRRNARAIASAVQRRAMPPWLPEPGHGAFAGERRLLDDQIALIANWVESGAPEGNPADLPKPPTFSGGWQLGTPDLVLTLPEPYVLRPGSRDVFRNFVIPVPIDAPRYVRAVEFRADRPQVLHHADLAIDLGRVSRALDRAEPGPGFGTMDGGQVQNVYGWSPGKVPVMEAADNAWTLNPGTDFVLLLHMIAGAKNETVQPTIGLFFSDTPPTRTPISVKLEAQGIAIPAGDANYVVEDSYVLPVDVDAVSIYPHAHYLGKEMRGTATLPDGSQQDLLWIRRWDFRWQDRYRYRSPVFLPRGTRLSMRFTYDNSAANPNNRSRPPQLVRSGPRSIQCDHVGFDSAIASRRGRRERKCFCGAWVSNHSFRLLRVSCNCQQREGEEEEWEGGLPPKVDRVRNLHQFPPDEFGGAAATATPVPAPQRGNLLATKKHKKHIKGSEEGSEEGSENLFFRFVTLVLLCGYVSA